MNHKHLFPQSLTVAQHKTCIIQHQMPKEAFLQEVEEVGLGCSQGLGLATLINFPGFSVFVLCTNRKFKLDPYNRMPTSLNFPGFRKPISLANFLQKLWLEAKSIEHIGKFTSVLLSKRKN